MKFKVGDLIKWETGDVFMVVKLKENTCSFIRFVPQYPQEMISHVSIENLEYFRTATDDDIVHDISERLRYRLLSNYAEGL